ncbi:O-acetyl-ADP-ribose deacetylase [Streptomonospora salina]|uniref:O-acetyl-ADP-ribose deacetylase (Regulator of RNase III) n=1 Tax=Streptomonospora salina TaxID=104205 RepID=A0A841EDX9_9ACTN|nr:O-acetyl-ADP-ribose deacetylase [Streptomonospora salina]MBB5999128.1 O-acetyl-ADP-ribose deacetylase (regulator of RNase III) [Streptomonospora salina]
MDITLVQGDITEQRVDAVVNAANSSLMGGGGVDGAVHRAGGSEVLAECRRIRATSHPDGLPPGDAVATTAGRMPATWVIHTVGPVYSTSEDRSATLASCYRRSLEIADGLNASSVAFPAVSAGVYGWPMGDAAEIAVRSIQESSTTVGEIRFALFSPDAYEAFAHALGSNPGPTS